MPLIKTSAKGQLVIPVNLRDKYGLKPGSFVYVSDTGKELVLTPAPSDPVKAACGYLQNKTSLSKELLKARKKENRHEKKKRS
jgi:AbrB family looped-hinge helix DNA binding protein